MADPTPSDENLVMNDDEFNHELDEAARVDLKRGRLGGWLDTLLRRMGMKRR